MLAKQPNSIITFSNVTVIKQELFSLRKKTLLPQDINYNFYTNCIRYSQSILSVSLYSQY